MQILWPSLPYENWKDTLETLHLWTQIVGKIKLKQNSFINHWWEVAFYLTSRGLTTGRIPYKYITFDVSFDFIFYRLIICTSKGEERIILLKPRTVSAFYKEFMQALEKLNIEITINMLPSEIPDPIPFEEDNIHKSYDGNYVHKWHQIQLQISFLLDEFRKDFRGKSSPVQFFWGSFDLNTTRFSEKKLPDKNDWPKGYKFMSYAENEENFACGFWPGNKKFPKSAFYSYLNPKPKGIEAFSYFNKELGECIFTYEKALKVKNPGKEILNFFQTTYSKYAELARWNIKELQFKPPIK